MKSNAKSLSANSAYSLLSALNIGRDYGLTQKLRSTQSSPRRLQELFRPLFLKPHNDARLVLSDDIEADSV